MLQGPCFPVSCGMASLEVDEKKRLRIVYLVKYGVLEILGSPFAFSLWDTGSLEAHGEPWELFDQFLIPCVGKELVQRRHTIIDAFGGNFEA